MLFSSVVFLFYFMPLFFLFYYALPWRNTVLLVGSLLFYSWGEPVYVLLLIVYICLNYFCGRLMSAFPQYGKPLLTLGIALNVALLLYFKYLGFIAANVAALARLMGGTVRPVPAIALPLGISFFTFQGISYLIDIRRGKAKVQMSLATFALYKAMFPQLIAGPVVRYTDVSSRLEHRPLDTQQIARGIGIFLVGLSQKVLIANTVALPADRIFSADVHSLTPTIAWFGTICYTLQIYFDFAGYSNMAIGLGHMLGFRYPDNFNLPYISQSITEFWRRWHMSLSTWFRDYLYIPLGGNRGSSARTHFNLFVVFLICGAWHGASWTFVIWGVYHGAFLVAERAGGGRMLDALPRPFRHLYTLIAVMVGWVFFRAHSLAQAGSFLKAMAGASVGDAVEMPLARYLSPSVAVGLLLGCLCAAMPRPTFLRNVLDDSGLQPSRPRVGQLAFAAALVVGFFLSTLSLAGGTYNPFIYFRF